MPVPTNVPPVEASYQLIVPVDAVAFKATVPGPQFFPAVVELIVGIGLITKLVAALQPPSLHSA